jgi:tetratricopeptide (TPR) repeat protein
MKLSPLLQILAIILVMVAGGRPGLAAEPRELAATDSLLESPTLDVNQARQALARYEAMLASPGSARAPLLMRLAQVSYFLGDLAPENERKGYYEKGLTYAELLLKEQPAGVAGHYWVALNLCGLADTSGKLTGYRLLPRIMEELQRVLALDETYDQAGAHRVLGRIYYEAPGRPFSVGDLEKSLYHLAAAVRLAPENSTNHLYLAETLLRRGDKAQARQELARVLTSTRSAIQLKGLEEDRQKARRRLQELGQN